MIRNGTAARRDARLAWIADRCRRWRCWWSRRSFPIARTGWESLHLHDLRMPWLRPSLRRSGELRRGRRRSALLGRPRHTVLFAAVSVALELALGLALALIMHRAVRGRAADSRQLPCCRGRSRPSSRRWSGASCSSAIRRSSAICCAAPAWRAASTWFADPVAAWVPIVLADVWKTTPFVAMLLLAGLQTIDPTLYEAARIDGAGPWRRFVTITLPLLAPALVVAAALSRPRRVARLRSRLRA